jgi:AbrB family looped-hinge helix DNA binding protein
MAKSILDEKGRVVLPREIAEELGLSKGSVLRFEREGKDIVLRKAPSARKGLEEVMDWDPERTGKVEKVTPRVMKEIWKS